MARAWPRLNAPRGRSPGTRLGLIGALLLAGFSLLAVAAPVVAPYDPHAQVAPPFAPPSRHHLLGANDVGQDLFSELIYGSRISLVIGTLVALASGVLGAGVALASGYLGGTVDIALMRVTDLLLALPFLPLLMVLAVFLGPGVLLETLVIGAVSWARPARELRSQVLSVRERDYVRAVQAMGANAWRITIRHVLPGVAPLIIPQFVRTAQAAILLEASLSFLGLGDPVAKSWGSTLFYANARGAFLTDAWLWWVLPTGLCISGVVIGFAFVGYALEERLSPGLRDVRGPEAVPRRLRERTPAPAEAALRTAPLLQRSSAPVEADDA